MDSEPTKSIETESSRKNPHNVKNLAMDSEPTKSIETESSRVEQRCCIEGMQRLETESVDLVLADPPYDIGVGGVEWDSVPKYMRFAADWLTEVVRILKPGGTLLFYGSPCKLWVSRMNVLLEDELRMSHVQSLSWVYTQGGDARMENMRAYATRHELLEWWTKPGAVFTFNGQDAAEHYTDEDRAVALAKGKGRVTEDALNRGRPPRTFIDIPRENSRSTERKYGKHPSMKPLPLCDRLVKVHSNDGDLIVVPFAGSGSEMIAATRMRRRVVGFELQRDYIDLMRRRFEGHGMATQFL